MSSKFVAPTKTNLPRKSSARAFKVPTKLIWGKEDTFNPLWVGRDMEKRLKKFGAKVEFHEIENAAHFVGEERPELVGKLLVEHWKQTSLSLSE